MSNYLQSRFVGFFTYLVLILATGSESSGSEEMIYRGNRGRDSGGLNQIAEKVTDCELRRHCTLCQSFNSIMLVQRTPGKQYCYSRVCPQLFKVGMQSPEHHDHRMKYHCSHLTLCLVSTLAPTGFVLVSQNNTMMTMTTVMMTISNTTEAITIASTNRCHKTA